MSIPSQIDACQYELLGLWKGRELPVRAMAARIETMFEGSERKQLEQAMLREGRLPPGQSLTLKWPVLHYGSVPAFDAAKWDFKISGLVAAPVRLTSAEFGALPQTEVTSDF